MGKGPLPYLLKTLVITHKHTVWQAESEPRGQRLSSHKGNTVNSIIVTNYSYGTVDVTRR